jgi:uncharacterized RDD family membrane protein YckC
MSDNPNAGWPGPPPPSAPPQPGPSGWSPPAPPGYGPPPAYVPPPQYGYGQYGYGYGAPAAGPPFADFWSRVGAYFLDALFGFLLLIPGIAAAIALLFVGPRETYTGEDEFGDPTSFDFATVPFIAGAVAVGLAWLIFTYCYQYGHLQGRKGQTWGKKILGIKVVDKHTGRPIGFWRGMGRWFLPQVFSQFTCGIFGLLDILWPLWDAKKQALHDKLMNSYVIKA